VTESGRSYHSLTACGQTDTAAAAAAVSVFTATAQMLTSLQTLQSQQIHGLSTDVEVSLAVQAHIDSWHIIFTA